MKGLASDPRLERNQKSFVATSGSTPFHVPTIWPAVPACVNFSTDPVAFHSSVIDCAESIVTVAVSSNRRGANALLIGFWKVQRMIWRKD
jgi:hypothetical protein